MARQRPLFAALLTLLTLILLALGAWQLERREGKLALINAVDTRAHAPPIPAPGPPTWPTLTPQADEYRHIQATGTWLPTPDTLVRAVTELGGGFWVLTPLRTQAGWTLLVNRGFIPFDHPAPAPPPGPATVSGLLRPPELPNLFRTNDPASNTWSTRDIPAIAAARHLPNAAPYFLDAERTPGTPDDPVPGLTVIRFPNNHLLYAFTWFGLSALSLFGLVRVLRAPLAPRPGKG